MALDFKCAISQCILTGIIYYLLMLMLFMGLTTGRMVNEEYNNNIRLIIITVSAFAAYLVNGFIFGGCGTTTGW